VSAASKRRLPGAADLAVGGIGAGGARAGLTRPVFREIKSAVPAPREYVDVSDNPQWQALEVQMDRARRAMERWEVKEDAANLAMREIAGDRDVQGNRFYLYHSTPAGPIDPEMVAQYFHVPVEFLNQFRMPNRQAVTIKRRAGRRR
jgi:hypothetical protein